MSRIEELENEIKELENRITDLQNELEFEKQNEEFVYSFKNDEKYFVIFENGYIVNTHWNYDDMDVKRYEQGNIFRTEKEAEKEYKKRILLTRFRQFRDKCNGDWKPDFDNFGEGKYYILFTHRKEFHAEWTGCSNHFSQFGYFKNEKDCERAIELFGDEIKQLYVEEE